jgi:hypothetical protein
MLINNVLYFDRLSVCAHVETREPLSWVADLIWDHFSDHFT